MSPSAPVTRSEPPCEKEEGETAQLRSQLRGGVMTDEMLDDPQFVATRERFWMRGLTDERFAHHRVAVAEYGGELIGIAQSAPPTDADATWSQPA